MFATVAVLFVSSFSGDDIHQVYYCTVVVGVVFLSLVEFEDLDGIILACEVRAAVGDEVGD